MEHKINWEREPEEEGKGAMRWELDYKIGKEGLARGESYWISFVIKNFLAWRIQQIFILDLFFFSNLLVKRSRQMIKVESSCDKNIL